MFNAVVVRKSASNVSYKVETVDESYLSKGDVLVKVVYSSINYKDMLALQYNGGVIRDYPMIPGIDFAGIVESSSNDKFKEGDNVLVTGYDVGVTHTGGFSEYAHKCLESGLFLFPKKCLLKSLWYMAQPVLRQHYQFLN